MLLRRAARGSARALVVWLGTLGYLLYQAVLFCFATPFNNLFLFYVAYLSLAVWSLVFLLRGMDFATFGKQLSPNMPIRYIAGYALVVAILNAAADSGPLAGILNYTDEPLVSIDLNHNASSSTVDSLETAVIDGKLVRVVSWYDNEWGFSNRMVDTAGAIGKLI